MNQNCIKPTIFLLFIFVILLSSCTSSKNVTSTHSNLTSSNTEERDGLSIEKAIIILEKTESVGVRSEYIWLSAHYPNYKLQRQSLTSDKNKSYDIMSIITAEGKEIKIYFDISHFFGKY